MRSKLAQVQIARLRKSARPTNAAAMALRLGIFSGTITPTERGKGATYKRGAMRRQARTEADEHWEDKT